MKRIVLFIGLILFCCSSAFSQELKEFADPKERTCDDHMFKSFGATTQDGVIVVYSAIQGLNFKILQGDTFLKDQIPDAKNNRYILVVLPTGGENRSYKLRIRANNYKYIDYDTGPISGGGKSSCCIEVNPKQSSALEKLAIITVYDKDNKLLVGAVVKDKTTGKVYGSTRYDGTLAINFDNKGETTNVIVSHPSYSDTKEITVQAGVHDYKVYLRSYKHPDNSSALWRSAILPGWGQFYKNRNGRGTLIVIGETLTLAAGGLSLFNELTQKNIMDKPEVSYQDYIAAEKSYEQWNTARHVSFITAAVIYGLNVVDAYMTPAKPQKSLTFAPNVMNANGEMAVGATLSINF